MRHVAAWGALWAGLLAGALLPTPVAADVADPTTSHARQGTAVKTSVSLRLAPPVITFDPVDSSSDPTGLVATIAPVRKDAKLTFQEYVGSVWTTIRTARTDATGRFFVPLTVTSTATRTFRVVHPQHGRFRSSASTATKLYVRTTSQCSPVTPLVDASPTGEAFCLATRLDRWRAVGLMGVGQQLNVSSQSFLDPIRPLGAAAIRTSLIGFDLEELAMARDYEFPFADQVVAGLLELAHGGAVLTASWHARNPFTGGPFTDTRRGDLSSLLNESTPAGAAFWADFDDKMSLLRRFQEGDAEGDGGGVGTRRTAVVFRPLHEANGGFFWWGKPNPAVYRQLWTLMQARAAAAGVHNILWAYSFNLDTSSTTEPRALLPHKVDVGGLDSYDPEYGAANAADAFRIEGYKPVAQGGVPRMAITEAGPHGSRDGTWNPAVISRTIRSTGITPLWTMLWFDDGKPTSVNDPSGYKQLTSLTGGRSWLSSCFNALCYLR
ncbi:Glycosyl hydrolase family 26 [Nocardioides szechwanensis]|uniref:Glycosyl hydrolase family 26 n=1 Tax=Nocardioides szechwanensis TaxID=1005944 RepID=A0A1G9XPC0_9ACTN|nr:glycosyl hydrolase [Nocardioides szechwanensis]SDM98689.1 Glycosyl hydrolase family 26 [Nocardioides szechwanensis]